MKRSRSGFTIIELLIVCAIIAVLSIIIFIQIDQARMRARDAARISDLHQIQIALEAYFERPPTPGERSQYPSTLAPLVPAGYLSAIPVDPKTRAQYSYKVDTGATVITSYCLGTRLETVNHQALSQSSSCTTDIPPGAPPGTLPDNYKLSR